MDNQKIINCHTHVFDRACVPNKFLPFWLRLIARLLESTKTAEGLGKLVTFFGKKNVAQLIQKFHYFLKVGDLKSQLEIFKLLQSFYPEGTKFCVLTMDMEFMQAGTVKKSFKDQLDELAALKKDPAYKDLIQPFIFIHPERVGIFSIVRQYIEEQGFAGLKMYPPLGYYPFDERLDQVFAYAEKNKLPITTHCSRGGIYYQGKITDAMKKHPITGKTIKVTKNKFLTDIYTDPDNYQYLLVKYPDLKVNLAHFGGADEWDKYLSNTIDETGERSWFEKVRDLVKKYPNVYTDVSYTMYNQQLYPLLKTVLQDAAVKNKVLFGSDYFMVEQEESEREFCINLRAALGESDFKLIAEDNPKLFLFNGK